MTLSSKFYYGLPEELWDNMMAEAEDLLNDEGLGIHLVGIYPAGNRIYGIESGVEGIMCLYVDTVESLVNPTYKSNNPEGFKTFKLNTYQSPIVMVNLFDWVQMITRKASGYSWKHHAMLHCIPFGDVMYQDNSVDEILQAAQKVQQADNFNVTVPLDNYDSGNTLYGPHMLFRRAEAILSKTGKFYPNINPAWGKVFSMNSITSDEEILKLDAELRRGFLNGQSVISPYHEHQKIRMWYEDMIKEGRKDSKPDKESIKELGRLTERLYRFQL